MRCTTSRWRCVNRTSSMVSMVVIVSRHFTGRNCPPDVFLRVNREPGARRGFSRRTLAVSSSTAVVADSNPEPGTRVGIPAVLDADVRTAWTLATTPCPSRAAPAELMNRGRLPAAASGRDVRASALGADPKPQSRNPLDQAEEQHLHRPSAVGYATPRACRRRVRRAPRDHHIRWQAEASRDRPFLIWFTRTSRARERRRV